MTEGTYELPEGWEWKSLPQVADITMGQSPPGSSYNSNQVGLPFFQGKADFGVLYPAPRVWCDKPKKVAEPEDVLLSVRAPVGPTNIASERCAIGRGLAAIRPRNGLPARLLREYLVHIEQDIAEKGTGSTFTAISRDVLESLAFPLPPLLEQQRLVVKIERLLAQSRTAREALDRIPPLLKRFRQAVLAKAFRGELTERDPNDEPASVLLERIREERRRKWEAHLRARGKDPRRAKYVEPEPPDKAGLPELPTGWAWARLSWLGELARGKSKHRPRDDPKLYSGAYPFVQTGDVARAKGTIKEYTQTYNEVGLAQSRLWPKGTLCITIAANIADTAVLGFDACFPDSVVGFVADASVCLLGLVRAYLQAVQSDIERLAPATAQKNINLALLEDMPIPLPPLNEQRRMVDKLDALDGKLDAIERFAARARRQAHQVDQAVLARAFRGEL